MKYSLFKVIEANAEIGPKSKTISMYNGESLKEIATMMKEVFRINSGIAKFLEPDLKTKSEIIGIASRFKDSNTTITTIYHIHVTKGNKTAPWGTLNPDEYTDFILDMKKWLKENINNEKDPLTFTSDRKIVETKSGYTIS